MKTTFTTEDGATFNTEAEARKHEYYLSEIEAIDRKLPRAIDSGCEFANGGGFIQHTPEALANWLSDVEKLLRKYEGAETADRWAQNPRGIVGRYLDDGGSPAYAFVYRVMSIGNDFREWGQPYYALNPGKMEPWNNVK